ncbi:GGDEF domain-containing phosphodiesterase [Meiothermus taiwanensis]|uniref:Phytochrome-like protein cph2 n=2 Tax=Meiothermus taiwanensis TaxID=172827 RepID=A0A399EA80_9DEIN|nr:GGDEF domain-containing phosphodiesterase [Meiothermus taiwanensis]AWR85817.1 diguanylate cyclase/phosphodiesterase with GAF sensor [Meiothermus taiwanensis WR-220]KIQ55416.1 diguanylate phosphodiesterase [Meiothermus taiwanensis]KZK14972.1 diguanylate phosphodiesterase [Meiothermus taiwanensis]RIH79790.1 Phytochrome-like protein cph2 [Meiothermus taiwanensis]
MNEVSWKLFAPLSIEGATLLIEHQDLPSGMAIRLGGAGGVVLKPQEAQELLLNLLTGESWVSSRLVWAAPRLHIGQKGYNLNERAKLALIEALQSLLVESQGVAVNPMPKETWQRSLLEITQQRFASVEEALPRLGEMLISLGLKGLCLWLRDGSGRTLKPIGQYPEAALPDELQPERHPVYFQVLERNLLIAADDARQDARMNELRDILIGRGLGAVLQAVLHGEGGLRGVVWIESMQPRKWSNADETLALAVAQVIERILRPLKDEIKIQTPERKSLAVRRSEFELNLAQALSMAQRYERSLALMRIQIDGMNKAQTERAAREIAYTLRQSDSLAYLGEQGFALLLSEVRWTAGASRVAHRLLGRLRAALSGLKVGIGIAMYPQDATTVEGLWNQAEQACQASLEAGGGIRLLTPGAAELQEAISQDGLTLHFQPVFNLSDLELVAVEALARWPRPKGLHQAGEFLPLAEQVGLMSAQDRWALEKVLEQAALWRPSGVNARFSINVSTETLIDPNFPSVLQEMLSAKRLPADTLIVELREEAILSDLETTSRSLEILKHLGVLVALDNFGSNPIPLTQLKRLPIDWIKLNPALSVSENAMLAKAAIDMVHAVGAKAVAKGLEEQSQLTRMKELGADHGQGHILGWPVPAEDLGALLVWGIGS